MGRLSQPKGYEVRQLAEAIVNEIKLRVANVNGDKPYRSLSDFVNRNLSNDEYGRRGLLQAAIEKSKINREEMTHSRQAICHHTSVSGDICWPFPMPKIFVGLMAKVYPLVRWRQHIYFKGIFYRQLAPLLAYEVIPSGFEPMVITGTQSPRKCGPSMV